MPLPELKGYNKGYAEGYRDGLADGLAGRQALDEQAAVCALPIACMGLSVRARNCLLGCGCETVGAAAGLTEDAIRRMRGLGKLTADEIARALHTLDIRHTAWDLFLLDP